MEKGFTLGEILITMAIITVILGFGTGVGIDFYRSYSLENDKNVFISALRKARSRAMTNVNQSAHGVAVADGQFVTFQGISYASRTPIYDQNFEKRQIISASGLNEIVFQPLRGNSSASGTVTLTDDRGKSKIIEINSEGRISE